MTQYLTKREFADGLGVSVRTVERKVNAGLIRLSGRTFGGHWRFTKEELERCLTAEGVIRRPRQLGLPEGDVAIQRAAWRRTFARLNDMKKPRRVGRG